MTTIRTPAHPPLRLAIIGFGMFGQRHAVTIGASADCALVAVASLATEASNEI